MRKLLSCVVFMLVFVAPAQAVNEPLPVIDAIASEFAGKPVTAHCETDNATWVAMVSAVFEPDPTFVVAGYTSLSVPLVYLSPRVCFALRTAALHGVVYVGPALLSFGLQIVIHEGYHQSGIVNEAQTDCLATKQIRYAAIKYFGVAELKRVKYFVRVRGRRVARYRFIPNPFLAELARWAVINNQGKPIEYQGGTC